MHRLKYSTVYLSGGMDRVPDGGAVWRSMIESKLKELDIGVLNPCNKPSTHVLEDDDSRKTRAELKKNGLFDEVAAMMRPISNIDLRMVDIAHFLIVYLDIESHCCGTYNEIFLATQQKKPILIMCEQGKDNVPDWLFGRIPHQTMFSAWDELMDYVHHINSDEEIDSLGRWCFFDFDKIFSSKAD